MFYKIHPENPEARKISQVVDILSRGGVIIYPTDTVYGIGCDIFNQKAVERICRLRRLNPAKAHLSFICEDISQASDYAQQIDNHVFRLLKRNLPGPFTFILNGNNSLPKIFKNQKKTFGLRIPEHQIPLMIARYLGRPLLTASLKRMEDDILNYYTDMDEIREKYENQVDAIIESGLVGNEPSTLIDCTVSPPVIVRQGIGELKG